MGFAERHGKTICFPCRFYYFERMITMVEDAMLHHTRRNFEAVGAHLKRCRELREKLNKAETPEEVAEIEAELEAERRAFNSMSQTETAVKTNG